MKKLVKCIFAAAFLEAWKLTGFRIKKVKNVADFGSPQNIAIFSTTALGDFFFNTPAIYFIKSYWPHAKITLIINKRNMQLVDGSSLFDKILFWNGKVNGLAPLISELKKQHIDATFLLHSRSPYDIIAASLSRSRIILKDVYYNDYQGKKYFFLARYLSSHFDNRQEGAIHCIEQKTKLLQSVGIEVKKPYEMRVPSPFVPFPREKITIGIHAGASGESRCWPTEKFARLIELLLERYSHIEIELLGGPGEAERNKKIIQQVNVLHDRITNLAGKTGLKQLIERIATQSCLIVGDTGPLHIAVALKTPVVALFPGRLSAIGGGPLQDPELHSVLISPDENQGIAAITVDSVFLAVQEKFRDGNDIQ